MSQLNKGDLQMVFVEANVLSEMTNQLSPMPYKSLHSARIRQELFTYDELVEELDFITKYAAVWGGGVPQRVPLLHLTSQLHFF